MKTDQIVAHGHAAIKQLLAYMGKIWAFLFPTLTLPMLSHSFSFPFFFLPWHRGKAYISYSLFISPSLLTVCVCGSCSRARRLGHRALKRSSTEGRGTEEKGRREKQSYDHFWSKAAAVSTAAWNLISPKRTAILYAFGCLFLACYRSASITPRARRPVTVWGSSVITTREWVMFNARAGIREHERRLGSEEHNMGYPVTCNLCVFSFVRAAPSHQCCQLRWWHES